MAPAMMSAGPVLRSSVIQCVNQPAASQEVQQAAVQVFRLVSVPHEASGIVFHFRFQISSELLQLRYSPHASHWLAGPWGAHAGADGQLQPHAEAHRRLPCAHEGPQAHRTGPAGHLPASGAEPASQELCRVPHRQHSVLQVPRDWRVRWEHTKL